MLRRFFRGILLILIGAYRTIGTTHLGGTCRFEPSCSEYALEATRLHAPHAAVRLIASRVVRCRPGGTYGFDPVPLPFRELNQSPEPGLRPAPAADRKFSKRMT